MAGTAFLGQAVRLERQIVALRERQRRYLELGLSCGEEGRARMRALAAEIEARVARLAEKVRRVEAAIDAVEEERYREVLRYRYLNGWSIHQSTERREDIRMKIITSVTVFRDAVGMRMSATYSEVDEATGRVVSDNQRFDRVVTDEEARANAQAVLEYAGESL